MKYFVILILVGLVISSIIISDSFADSDPNDDYLKFALGEFYIYADNKHIVEISLDWNGLSLPHGTVTFDEKINTDINIMIPKNIPRTMNLDFKSSMSVFYPNSLIEPIKETNVDCFYHLRIPVKDSDEINIDSISVAAGRLESVTVNEPKCDDVYKNYFETYDSRITPFGINGMVIEIPTHENLNIEKINDKFYYVSESFELNSETPHISFHDVLFSPPYAKVPPRYIYSDVVFSDGTKETLSVLLDYPDFGKHTTPQAGLAERTDGYHFLISADLEKLSPLKQFNLGIPADEIKCKDGLERTIKINDFEKFYCTGSNSRQILIERGWAFDDSKGCRNPIDCGGRPPLDKTIFPVPEPEPEPIAEEEQLFQEKQNQARIQTLNEILTDRENQHQIDAINKYRQDFEPSYFLEPFVIPNKHNFEKDEVMNFVVGQWGYQPEKCISYSVQGYFKPYENYDPFYIEKISVIEVAQECDSVISSDSNGYIIVNMQPIPGIPEDHQTCTNPGEYRILVRNLKDEPQVEWGYYTCQRDKLVGEPQPWMEIPE